MEKRFYKIKIGSETYYLFVTEVKTEDVVEFLKKVGGNLKMMIFVPAANNCEEKYTDLSAHSFLLLENFPLSSIHKILEEYKKEKRGYVKK